MTTLEILKKAKSLCPEMCAITEEIKNNALINMADSLIENTEEILKENEKDIKAARGIISDVMIDRLALSKERIEDMAKGIRKVASLPDPVGNILSRHELENGLIVEKTSVPMGVVAIIYESRPNVTSDAASLALKSGNVCVLRSGKEAYYSAKAIVNALKKGLKKTNLNPDIINLVEDTTRQSATELMTATGYVDLLIPRGGAGLIKACVENAKVPVIQTGTGICHIYADESADFDKALNIIYNAKTSRPSVCNACEVVLVSEKIADEFLPRLKRILTDERKENPVELRLDEKANKIIDGTPAKPEDFDTEFLDYILGVKIVSDVKEAVSHILHHSTGHSEAIIAEDISAQNYFASAVDSAAVYINASTRFTDGGEFGLGCEMGISTQKLHARGPMGLCELTAYKYIVRGIGQTR